MSPTEGARWAERAPAQKALCSEAVSHGDRVPPGADMDRFVSEQMAFVGLGADDMALIRETAPLVLAHGEALTTALYDHFLRVPESARFFLREDGSPDRERIERRKHSLKRWLKESVEIAVGEGVAYYLLGVALSHSHRQHGPGGAVPPELMVGAMSLTQTALAGVLEAELADARRALRAVTAWNKLSLVHLNILLQGYLLPPSPVRD